MGFGSNGQITKLAMLGVFAVCAVFLFQFATGGNLSFVGGSGNLATTTVTSTDLPVTAAYLVTSVDLKAKAVESIADTTGVKNGVAADLAFYKAGDTTAFTSSTGSATAYTSSTNDPAPVTDVFLVANATNYYPAKSPVQEVPYASEMMWSIEMDRINSLTGYVQNSSSGDWRTPLGNDTLTTDQQITLTYKLTGGTARGVFAAPIVICVNYDTTNFSSTGTYLVNGVKTDVPTGVAAGYEGCWISDLTSIKDTESKYFSFHLTPASGVNPADSNVTLKVIDCGATYTKAAGDILYTGCQNADSLAAIGATDVLIYNQIA